MTVHIVTDVATGATQYVDEAGRILDDNLAPTGDTVDDRGIADDDCPICRAMRGDAFAERRRGWRMPGRSKRGSTAARR